MMGRVLCGRAFGPSIEGLGLRPEVSVGARPVCYVPEVVEQVVLPSVMD